MIQTVNISLLNGIYAGGDWSCVIEIPVENSLEDLHDAIQDAVEFDNDHLYEFYIANSYRGKKLHRYDCDDDVIVDNTVAQVFTEAKGKKVFYMFDYGDSWLFQLTTSRKKPHAAEAGIIYPRVVSETGAKPEQYPDWDEEC